jgi:TrmH family RNA methyltransferase
VRVDIPEQFHGLKVVLVQPRNPLNIGAAARAMSNFGFLRMRVVNPYAEGYREARSAVGASGVLLDAEEFATVAEAVADCTLVVGTTAVGERELHHRVKALPDAARILRQKLGLQPLSGGSGRGAKEQGGALRENVALLFGSERVGLSNEDLSHCHWLLRIPTRVEHRSMNLGQAVAICMYELGRNAGGGFGSARPSEDDQKRANTSADKKETRKKAPHNQQPRSKTARLSAEKRPATAGDVERITTTLLEALHACGYLHEKSGKVPREKIRRLLRRHKLTANDADLWLSMLGQMVYTLRKSPPRE